MPKPLPPTLMNLVNWPAIVRQVAELHEPDTLDLEDAIAMAQEAVRRWGEGDLGLVRAGAARVVGVETKFTVGCSTGTRDLTLQFADGSYLLRDWKSAYNLAGEKLANWFKRLERSHQHGIYARSLGVPAEAVAFEYCGVSRKLETATLPLGFTPKDFAHEQAYLEDTQTCIRTLVSARPSGPWPKNKPQGCGAYGRDCPELAHGCIEGNDPSSAGVELVGEALRYSHAGLFWLCPERYRREMMRLRSAGAEAISEGREMFDDAFEPPLLGTLLHSLMERVYLRVQEENL